MKSVVRQGLVAPGVVGIVTLLTWAIGGTGWAFAILALGAAALIGWHLHNAQRVFDWATGEREGDVPEGRREWGEVFAALYRRVRLREAHQRDLQHIISRFREAAEA